MGQKRLDMSMTDYRNDEDWDCGIRSVRAHSTPDPDLPPPGPPVPDDVPPPQNAPVQEPKFPEPPIKAAERFA